MMREVSNAEVRLTAVIGVPWVSGAGFGGSVWALWRASTAANIVAESRTS